MFRSPPTPAGRRPGPVAGAQVSGYLAKDSIVLARGHALEVDRLVRRRHQRHPVDKSAAEIAVGVDVPRRVRNSRPGALLREGHRGVAGRASPGPPLRGSGPAHPAPRPRPRMPGVHRPGGAEVTLGLVASRAARGRRHTGSGAGRCGGRCRCCLRCGRTRQHKRHGGRYDDALHAHPPYISSSGVNRPSAALRQCVPPMCRHRRCPVAEMTSG